MNVNMNVMTNTTPKKQDSPKQFNKSQEFKNVLDNHELSSRNSSISDAQKKYNKQEELSKTDNKNQSATVANKDVEKKDVEKNTIESSTAANQNNSEDNKAFKIKLIKLIEVAMDKLKEATEGSAGETTGQDNSKEQMAQLQQLLQLLSSMFQNVQQTPTDIKGGSESNLTGLESLMGGKQLITAEQLMASKQLIGSEQLLAIEKLNADASTMIKSNLSEIMSMLEKSKSSNVMPAQTTDVLQKLTTVVETLKGDLNLLKVPTMENLMGNSEDKSIKDTLLKKVLELSTDTNTETISNNQMQSSKDSSKGSKFSDNNSSEEKFLKNLLGGDKDEMKISKTVNFMNQFETVKTQDTAKVQTVNLLIDKNNFTVDVIKNIKFMEINNIKDLTVKMNPKELGEITIKLTMESGIMKASISAQNKETFNLLNVNMQDISDKLKNMDIKIQSLDINIYEDSTFFNKNSNEKNSNGGQNNGSSANIISEEEDIPLSIKYANEENQVNKFV